MMTKPKNNGKGVVQEENILLHSLHLSNFLSFGPETPAILFGPLNVLIGTNGSGKSNLIEAVALLRSCPLFGSSPQASGLADVVRRGGGIEEWIWKGDPDQKAILNAVINKPTANQPLRHVLEFNSEKDRFRLLDERIENEQPYFNQDSPYFYYKYQYGNPLVNVRGEEGPRKLARETVDPDVSILAQRNDQELYPELSYLIQQYRKIAIYREWQFGRSTVFRQPQRSDLRVDGLEEDFSNLGLFLNHLTAKPKTKKEIFKHLHDIYEEVDDFSIRIVAGNVQVFFNEADFTVPATRISDGTIRYLCLLAILCDPTPPPLICIEEPELGLHPDIMPKIVDLLVEASTRTQLIVTTHSEILVDAMTKRPEAVLVVEKHDGQTEIKRVPPFAPDDRLGTLWMEGEIGGTRW